LARSIIFAAVAKNYKYSWQWQVGNLATVGGNTRYHGFENRSIWTYLTHIFLDGK